MAEESLTKQCCTIIQYTVMWLLLLSLRIVNSKRMYVYTYVQIWINLLKVQKHIYSLIKWLFSLRVEASGARQPRLFYVTTQSTTSTVTTASYCWATSAATTGTCKRRKRSGNFFPASALTDENIAPSKWDKLAYKKQKKVFFYFHY